MTLMDEFKSEPVRRGGPKPILDRIMQEMEPRDADDLKGALNDGSIPCRSIANVLARRGLKVSIATIEKYRRANGSV